MSKLGDRVDGKKVCELRERAGLTQQALASKAGVSKDAISSWEAGRQITVQRRSLQAVAGALGVLPKVLILPGTEPPSGPIPLLFAKTWEISASHLTGLLESRHYRQDGTLSVSEPPGVHLKYTEALFTAPRESAIADSFLSSDKRGILFVGGSGIGKSNLLCHHFLKLRKQQRLALFLSARRIESISLASVLTNTLAKRISSGYDLAALNADLSRHETTLTVFFDGINEYYKSDGGPAVLLGRLVEFIHDGHFCNIRFIMSCRSEIWHQYIQDNGPAPLSSAAFFPPTGDAVALSGFESEGERGQLYSRFQTFHCLLPLACSDLPGQVQSLAREPFLMAIIAETYSNRDIATASKPRPARTISRIIDYYAIFRLLTNRKLDDAILPWAASPAMQSFVRQSLETCLYEFAKHQLERLTSLSSRGDRLNAGPDLAPGYDSTGSLSAGMMPPWFFEPLRTDVRISPIDLLIQVGLIQRTLVTDIDPFGEVRDITAFRFFHDRYTEYWIAAVYRREHLGSVCTADLTPQATSRICSQINGIFIDAMNAPVLAGALSHWLHLNMKVGQKDQDFLVPLLNELAASRSGTIRHYVGAYVSGLVSKKLLGPESAWSEMLKGSGSPLKLAMAECFLEGWQEQPEGSLRAFVYALDEEVDDRVLRSLADIFAHLFTVRPQEILSYLERELLSVDSLPTALLRAATARSRHEQSRHLSFVFKFVLIAILTNFDRNDHMFKLGAFLRTKYRVILDLLTGPDSPSIMPAATLRRELYRRLESSGINMWEQAIGGQGGNDTFYVEDGGVIQRDLLYEFYPFVVAIHNGESDKVDLARGSPFRQILLKMLVYRPASVVGYVATSTLPLILCNHLLALEDLIDELIADGTASARCFANLLLVNIAFAQPDSCPVILGIMNTKLLPWLLANESDDDWQLLGCTSIAALDFDEYWGHCEPILETICVHLTKRASVDRVLQFGDALLQCNFHPNSDLGPRVARFLLQRRLLSQPLWRPCVVKVMGALLATNPPVLRSLLLNEGLDEATLNEIRESVSNDLWIARDKVFYQLSWNRFIVKGLASLVTVRYFLIKVLLCGAVQSNCVEEYAREFRRFVVETTRALLNDQPYGNQYAHLSLESALAETEVQRRVGQGEKWISK